jgi:hypothetical protein
MIFGPHSFNYNIVDLESFIKLFCFQIHLFTVDFYINLVLILLIVIYLVLNPLFFNKSNSIRSKTKECKNLSHLLKL